MKLILEVIGIYILMGLILIAGASLFLALTFQGAKLVSNILGLDWPF